jgi:hypothetical protein
MVPLADLKVKQVKAAGMRYQSVTVLKQCQLDSGKCKKQLIILLLLFFLISDVGKRKKK